MTDRHQGYLVTLAVDLGEEDSATVMTALRMIRGVAGVEPIAADGVDLVARAGADARWRQALVTLVQLGPDCVRNPRAREQT